MTQVHLPPQPCMSRGPVFLPQRGIRVIHTILRGSPSGAFASVTPNLDSDSNLGPPFLGQRLCFSHSGQKSPTPRNQHSWGPKVSSQLCAGPEVPKRCLLWRGCVCTQENKVQGKAKCFILRFPCDWVWPPLHPALSSSQEGKGLESTEPFPRRCRLRTVFCFAPVFVCREDRVHASTHTRGSPSMLTSVMSRTAAPVKPSHSSCAPSLGSPYQWSVSSTKPADFSRCLFSTGLALSACLGSA